MDCCSSPAKKAGPMPLDAVLDHVLQRYGVVTGVETVPVGLSLGRVLAAPVTAPVDVPPVAVSAMDGYAYASSDAAAAPLRRRLVGRVPAGASFEGAVAPGEAVRIFTGAPLPAGADTVVMQEDCRAEDGAVTVLSLPEPGDNIRPAGEDMKAGAVVLEAGRLLRAQEVGLAAAVGSATLPVRQRLRVVLFSTGDELREPGTAKPSHAIYDANRYTLNAQLTALGVEVRDLGILADKAEVVRAALADAAQWAHLIITSGGVSVGEEDHVKAAVTALGAIDLWTLAIKPGKPLALGRVGAAAFLGLPGNPVSAMVTFMLVGRPLVLSLMGGGGSASMPRSLVVAGFSFTKKPGRQEFLRVRLEKDADGRPVARKFPSDSSGVLTSMVESDGLVDMPAAASTIREGDIVSFMPFTGLLG